MLSQSESELLRAIEKQFQEKTAQIPSRGQKRSYPIESHTNDEKFTLTIARGNKNPLKCNYNMLVKSSTVLLRVDTHQTIHINPDGAEIPAPHLHIYQEGYGDSFAYPLPESFRDSSNLVETLRNFLSYSNVINVDSIQIDMLGGLFDDQTHS